MYFISDARNRYCQFKINSFPFGRRQCRTSGLMLLSGWWSSERSQISTGMATLRQIYCNSNETRGCGIPIQITRIGYQAATIGFRQYWAQGMEHLLCSAHNNFQNCSFFWTRRHNWSKYIHNSMISGALPLPRRRTKSELLHTVRSRSFVSKGWRRRK